MPKYNFIEYIDKYFDTSESLWQIKRDEMEGDDDLTDDGNHIRNRSSSFKYKSSLITNRNGVKIAVLPKYLSNFWRSLEMPLINSKTELSLTWDPSCVLRNLLGDSTFTITDEKFYVPIVTLSLEDNTKLSNLLNEGFKRQVSWFKYKIIPSKKYDANDYIRERLDASDKVVKRLFVLACRDRGGANRVTAGSHRRYFLPRVKIENYNFEIGGRNVL